MAEKQSHSAEELLEAVVRRYLGSGDFNGFYIGSDEEAWKRAAHTLIESGHVEVIDETVFPNPHIRPWPNRKSREEQIASLEAALARNSFGACLYPTARALAANSAISKLVHQPYRQRLAQGGTTLELAYFRFDVLEAYRNDPTFSFDFEDFGADIAVTDEIYRDEDAPEDDKITLRLGFAYQLPLDEGGPIIRRACVFLGDLAKLTPVHQRRWHTYEVLSEGLKPHPVWWMMQMGEWPDGVGPFEGLMYELASWNELHARAFSGADLLKMTERPRDFGWILRSSQREFDHFVQDLDKLLSDNLRHQAFDEADIPRKDEEGRDHGTLTRLDLFLEKTKVAEDARKQVLAPLRAVRAARSKPAHAIRKNITDQNFIRRQAELLSDVHASIHQLRIFWQAHPKNQDWEEPGYMKDSKYYWL